MYRDYKVYLNDILEAIRKIQNYTRNMGFSEFKRNELVQDAVIRNLEIIGEAVKRIPDDIKRRHPTYRMEENCWTKRYLNSRVF